MSKVKFIAKEIAELKIVYKRDQHGWTVDDDGRQIVVTIPAEYIEFKGHVFETEDADKIAFIRNHAMFNGVSDVKRVEEVKPPDPQQQRLMEYLKQYGYGALVQAAEKQFGQSPGVPVTDPVAHTLQHVQQQAQQQIQYPAPQPMSPQQAQINAMHQSPAYQNVVPINNGYPQQPNVAQQLR